MDCGRRADVHRINIGAPRVSEVAGRLRFVAKEGADLRMLGAGWMFAQRKKTRSSTRRRKESERESKLALMTAELQLAPSVALPRYAREGYLWLGEKASIS